MPQAALTRRAVGRPAGRVAALIAATSAAPKCRRSPSWPSGSTCGQLPSASWPIQFRLHRSPLRCLSEASIPPIAFSRHCSSRKISTPNWRDRSCTGSSRKSRDDLTLARHRPSRSPSGPAGKAWPGENVDEPSSPAGLQQQLSSQNYRSCSVLLGLRLSQFQGKTHRELERYHPGLHEQISKEEIRRYVDREGNGAFANTAPSVSKRRLGKAGQDLLALVLQFRDTAAAKLSSFAILERVLRDQFEIVVSRTRFPWTQNWLNRSVQGGPEHDR